MWLDCYVIGDEIQIWLSLFFSCSFWFFFSRWFWEQQTADQAGKANHTEFDWGCCHFQNYPFIFMSLSKLSTTRFLVFVADIFMSSSKRPNVQTSKCPIVDWQGDDAQVIPDIFCNSPTGGTSTSSNHRPVNGVSSSSSRFFFLLIKVILMLMLIADVA